MTKRFVWLFAALALLLPGTGAASASSTYAQTAPQTYTGNFLAAEPDNIDPNKSSFAIEAAVIRQVFEPLLRFDQNLVPQPAAAQSYDVSADGLRYTFHLRPDGRWSDGQPVTAADFEYSWKRLLDPNTAAQYADFVVSANVVGAADFNTGKGSADAVGVHALDPLTLEIDLTQPAGYFPDIAALWVLAPVRSDVIQQYGDSWSQSPDHYIGNGPYMMTDWVHQDHISLAPNPYYHGPTPTLQQINMLMVTDLNADYAAYLNGERDIALVPDQQVDSVLQDPVLSLEAHKYVETTTFWLGFNTGKAPLSDPRVRRAFSQSIDRNAFISDILDNVGQKATSLIPPGMPGYQADLGQDIDFNPTAARAGLAAAGFPDPSRFPAVNFIFQNTTLNTRQAEFIRAQLKQNLGVTVNLQAMEAKTYQAAYKAKQFDLQFGGWGAEYPDPQDWFRTLFGCTGDNNKFNYCNPTFDGAVNAGDTASDLTTRLQYYGIAQGIFEQELPVAPVYYSGRLVLIKPYVQNVTLTPQDDFPSDLFLDQIAIAPH